MHVNSRQLRAIADLLEEDIDLSPETQYGSVFADRPWGHILETKDGLVIKRSKPHYDTHIVRFHSPRVVKVDDDSPLGIAIRTILPVI